MRASYGNACPVQVNKWVGSGKPGYQDGAQLQCSFNEPSGLAFCALPCKGASADAGSDSSPRELLFVADTNNHSMRVVDVAKGATTTMACGAYLLYAAVVLRQCTCMLYCEV